MRGGEHERDVFTVFEAKELLLVSHERLKSNNLTSGATRSKRSLFFHSSSDVMVDNDSRDAPIDGMSKGTYLRQRGAYQSIPCVCQSPFQFFFARADPMEDIGKCLLATATVSWLEPATSVWDFIPVLGVRRG